MDFEFCCKFILKSGKTCKSMVLDVSFDYMQVTDNKLLLFVFNKPDSPIKEFYLTEIEFIL